MSQLAATAAPHKNQDSREYLLALAVSLPFAPKLARYAELLCSETNKA